MPEDNKPNTGLNLGKAKPNAEMERKEQVLKEQSEAQNQQVEDKLNQDLKKAQPDANHDPKVTGAHIKEDAGKSLEESAENATVQGQTVEDMNESYRGVAAGVVQEDNIGSNDHGQADPRNNELSEFEESKRGQLTDMDLYLNPDITAARTGDLESGEVAYTSHPIANYQIGDFKFTNGVLRLKGDKIDAFEKLLNDENFPESERHKIKKLDIQGAEAISRKVREETNPRPTQQTDSTIGDRGMKPLVGKGNLADSRNGGAVE